MSPGAVARRWGARVAVIVRRAADRAADGRHGLSRAVRTGIGASELPASVWRAATGPTAPAGMPLPLAVLPLPAPTALLRALTGASAPSLDAWAPRGPVDPDAPGLALLPVTGDGRHGTWTPATAVRAAADALEDAAGTCASGDPHRPGPPRPGPAAVLGTASTDPDTASALRSALRRLPRAHRARLLLADGLGTDPATTAGARTLAVLALVDAVALTRPDAADPALRDIAAAAGRAVVAAPAGTARVLAAAGRRARLDLAWDEASDGSGPGPTPDPVPHPAAEDAAHPPVRVGREPRRVVVAGHDLKFAAPLLAELRARGHEVRVDEWNGHARHDLEVSRALAAWADVVHAEWSLGNAVWYSRHLPKRTRLTMRTHLQENATPFPAQVRAEAVDAWVCVADHVREQLVRDARVPAARTHVVPNAVCLPAHQPADDTVRRHVLGLVGVLPERKGLHRALDLLAELRADDPRYTLRIRGHRPEDVTWMASHPDAAAYYARQRSRIETDPALVGAVTWNLHGPDMGAWFSRVGVALSVSDFESFHFTLPDGAAHGCVPRSLAWAGADRLYPAAWLAADVRGLAASVRAVTADEDIWRSHAEAARALVASRFATERVTPALADLVLGQD